jgi:DNA-binding response OmpR family regulator
MSWAADAYIVKSSDLSELKNTIKEILTKKTKEP